MKSNSGMTLLSWLVILAVITVTLAMMTDIQHVSAQKNLGDQLSAVRDATAQRIRSYGQNPTVLYNFISNSGNTNLINCLNATSCNPALMTFPAYFTLYDSSGASAVAGTVVNPSILSYGPPETYTAGAILYGKDGNTCTSPMPGSCQLWAASSYSITCSPDCSQQQNILFTVTGTVGAFEDPAFYTHNPTKTLAPLSRIAQVSVYASPVPAAMINGLGGNNGVCGPANGGSYATSSAVNAAGLCAYGTAAPATVGPGPGTLSWVCNGAGGPMNPSCSATSTGP